MATALAVTPLQVKSTREQSERIGSEIAELCSYIYSAVRAGRQIIWDIK